ncbi:lipoyl(octanoyl) transferase LipB [Paremcibacter congregatus]|uniref:Octanoyltransferase n=1 Tax=Paremcibacter congregatus TaxID=2043170 RepID=A0A2G4YVA0_9PROT|nr:lipoyl(octanoyl) transferase LipB [Paremcibacter congregatus]PHZ86237.1 lipoate-protein ligase B [Paremcibacter congregatus]QDE27203.1 lipoyl(octanoyl) transferase LipB [Paremcibacter congregatus]
MIKAENNALEWKYSDGLVDYDEAMALMEQRVADIRAGTASELVWFLQHPPLYTAGTSADAQDLMSPDRFPVYETGRGGQYTYHGPGQRVVYVMLDLARRGRDVRQFVSRLEQWVIDTLSEFNVSAERRDGRVGVWVTREGGREEKIAAIGVRVRKWVTFHGICINVEPDLDHYTGIVPCGISEHGVTSLVDLGLPVTLFDVDAVLRQKWDSIFEDTSTNAED